jgi:hypothetical protein
MTAGAEEGADWLRGKVLLVDVDRLGELAAEVREGAGLGWAAAGDLEPLLDRVLRVSRVKFWNSSAARSGEGGATSIGVVGTVVKGLLLPLLDGAAWGVNTAVNTDGFIIK